MVAFHQQMIILVELNGKKIRLILQPNKAVDELGWVGFTCDLKNWILSKSHNFYNEEFCGYQRAIDSLFY